MHTVSEVFETKRLATKYIYAKYLSFYIVITIITRKLPQRTILFQLQAMSTSNSRTILHSPIDLWLQTKPERLGSQARSF